MKGILVTAFLFATTVFAQAQNEEPTGGFKRENIFVGSSINIGIGNGGYVLGGNPQVGYSINRWLDAGITTNVIYSSQRFVQFGSEYRQRGWNLGLGPFVRVFPINAIHLQAQYEYNWNKGNVQHIQTGTRQSFNVSAPSLLVGAGYGQRIVGRSGFFTTILFDITKNDNSPYVFHEGGQKIALPIFRAGFIIYLPPKQQ